WLVGAAFAWAGVFCGTFLAPPFLHPPLVLLLAPWGLFGLECVTPGVLFLRGAGRVVAGVPLATLPLVSQAMITINFAPLMVGLLVFLPLESLAPRVALPGRLEPWLRRTIRERRSVAC